MPQTNLLDLVVDIGAALIVIAIFTLAYIIYAKGGQCVINPCAYADLINASCSPQPYMAFNP